MPAKKSEPYILRDVPISPEEEILEEFRSIRNSKNKILLAEKLFALSTDKTDLKKDLPEILDTLTQSIKNHRRNSAKLTVFMVFGCVMILQGISMKMLKS